MWGGGQWQGALSRAFAGLAARSNSQPQVSLMNTAARAASSAWYSNRDTASTRSCHGSAGHHMCAPMRAARPVWQQGRLPGPPSRWEHGEAVAGQCGRRGRASAEEVVGVWLGLQDAEMPSMLRRGHAVLHGITGHNRQAIAQHTQVQARAPRRAHPCVRRRLYPSTQLPAPRSLPLCLPPRRPLSRAPTRPPHARAAGSWPPHSACRPALSTGTSSPCPPRGPRPPAWQTR